VHASNIKYDINFEWIKKNSKNIIGRGNIVMSVRWYIDNNNKKIEGQMHFVWGGVYQYPPLSRKQLDVVYVIKSQVHKINFLWANKHRDGRRS